MRFVSEHVLVSQPEYQAVLHELCDDFGRQMLTIHIDVAPEAFNAQVLRKIRSDWRSFRACTDATIFAIEPHPDDEKWQRFVAPLGFEHSSRVECTDGQSRRVFVSNKKKNNVNEQHAAH